MTLFEHRRKEIQSRSAPLSTRMRPQMIEEMAGQEHLLGAGKPLRKAIEEDRVPSMILWGPPGSGKTTLARIIAKRTRSHFEQLSAVTSGVADLRTAIQAARDRLGQTGQRTIVFVDEIHRFSKSQQDALLPHVEDGTVVLIGATTENPSFEVISPLLSRARVYVVKPLSNDDVAALLHRALKDEDRGIGLLRAELTEEARDFLVHISNGDARSALDSLELAAYSAPEGKDATRRIDIEVVKSAIQRQASYDRQGDLHYDVISAFIKSIRGSDPDAAIYYLARMIDAGEDPLFIARRMVIAAAEDVGLADPNALVIAVAAQQAVHFVGMPEGRIPLAEAAVYLASAPKSNSAYAAIGKALGDVRSARSEPVPLHLRNAPTGLMRELGYGKAYKYSHDFPGHFSAMENLPENLRGRRYYFPGTLGVENQTAQRLRKWWGERYAPRKEDGTADGGPPPEGRSSSCSQD